MLTYASFNVTSYNNIRLLHFSFGVGQILDRFSKDMGAIDEVLPVALMNSLHVITYYDSYLIHTNNFFYKYTIF